MQQLAARQHGVVARSQLIDLGAHPRLIDEWVTCRRLVVVHRGVYALGSRNLPGEGRWMAAVLVGGPDSALSHVAAAGLHELLGHARPIAHVTVARRRRSRPGIVFQQNALPSDEITVVEGIPVTTVARTLLDVAATWSKPRLRQAVSLAEHRLVTSSPSLPALIERYPGRRGLADLREILSGDRLGLDLARSELEIEFQEFLYQRGLPLPEINAIVEVGGRQLEVDCLWRSQRFVVELDSRAHHAGWETAETDRARDLTLLSGGFRCARVTARKLRRDADRLEVELRAALRAS
ncbi:MAG TPA: type IV toxin-antitoxin system AbiEi family antitoxin domain-containing protein [Solirubrobacterales bacterium]|nr:type IV toxin-antitoxin system AbiEi family antitoxin domain-containing protein [Solirubrobacterales bacterium]